MQGLHMLQTFSPFGVTTPNSAPSSEATEIGGGKNLRKQFFDAYGRRRTMYPCVQLTVYSYRLAD